jgi:hypothetical protein
MNISMLTWSAALIVGGVVGTVVQFRRFQGIERTYMTMATIAIVALGAVGIIRASGYLADRDLFLTLNIVLPSFFFATVYQVYRHKKKTIQVP